MHCIASNVMVVSKDSHKFESGDEVFRIQCTNGEGMPVNVDVDESVFDYVVPLDTRYDMEIDFYNVGWKVYTTLVKIAEH